MSTWVAYYAYYVVRGRSTPILRTIWVVVRDSAVLLGHAQATGAPRNEMNTKKYILKKIIGPNNAPPQGAQPNNYFFLSYT